MDAVMSTSIVSSLLASVFLIGLVNANCCLPKQYEGELGSIRETNVGNRTTLFQAGARYASDSINGLIASNMSIVNGKTKEHIQILQDYKKHVSYTLMNGQCHKSQLPGDFPRVCIPVTAKKIYETYFGAGSDILNIVSYQWQERSTTITATLTESCIPVSINSFSLKGNEKFLEVDGYTGIQLRIKDRSVFDIPAACKQQSFFKEYAQIASQIMKERFFPGF